VRAKTGSSSKKIIESREKKPAPESGEFVKGGAERRRKKEMKNKNLKHGQGDPTPSKEGGSDQ